jgi:hypothetical protein
MAGAKIIGLPTEDVTGNEHKIKILQFKLLLFFSSTNILFRRINYKH